MGPRTTRLHACSLYRCVLWLCCLTICAEHVQATLISSSKISYCTDSGDAALNCTKKMVVTMTVEAGQVAGEESVVFLDTATDETTAAGATDASTVNFAPISITTSRSAVRYRYPVFYVQNFNAQPYEATVKGKLLNQCNADFNPSTATCGLAYDSNGTAIPSSQGFCCDCSMCQTLGFCNADARANNACNIFDKYTTASCLRFGTRWYSGYTVGAYMTWFTLNVSVTRNTTTGTGSTAAAVVRQAVELQLSPSVLGATAGVGWGASARIVGSFAPNDQPLDLTSHMLFAPALPFNDVRVLAGAAEWMLLSTTLVSLNGLECNKVGVSYKAFASQGNKCNLAPGSCLSSQLEDYRTADQERVAAGKKAQYMATGFGNFELERVPNTTTSATSPYISYMAASPAATMIVLTVDADDLEYIVGVANGKIVSATLNRGSLEASTKDGVLTVVVKNVAAVMGRLVVSAQKCTAGVFPMAAQTLSLAAAQQSSLRFNIYMQDSFASGKASCTVVVQNAEEVVTDSREVSWTVTPAGFNNGTQSGNGGDSTEERSAATCDRCGTLNIVCAFKRTCWQLILLDLLVYLIIAAAAFCVIWFRRFFCCCFYKGRCGKGGSGSDSSHHHKHHRHDGNERRHHSPTRADSASESDTPRRSPSRKLSRTPTPSSQLQRYRGEPLDDGGGGGSSSGQVHGLMVVPRPPPMMYTTAPLYPTPASHHPASAFATATSPFSSPLRVYAPPPPPPPLLAPPPPPMRLCENHQEGSTPNGPRSPAAFALDASAWPDFSSAPPPSFYGRGVQGEVDSPALMSPLTPPLSARGAGGVYNVGHESATARHSSVEWGDRGSHRRARSPLTTPSPSPTRRRYAPFA